MAPSSALLEVRELTVEFGGLRALDAVTFAVSERSVCGIIGPNGAGKTTVFNCLSRIYEPSSGTIRFAGADLLAEPPHRVPALGIARTFQNVALFDRQSVRRNVEAGCFLDSAGHRLGELWPTRASRDRRRALDDKVQGLLAEARLEDVAETVVTDLPFGIRKRVELARALAMRPKLLLLDEPAAGLNHAEIDQLAGWIRDVRERRGIAVLLIEHHMHLVLQVSDRVVVLNFGRTIADGTPREVIGDAAVVAAYLGGAAA